MSATGSVNTYKRHWWFLVTALAPWFIPIFMLLIIGQFTPLVPLIDEAYQRFYGYFAGFILCMMVLSFAVSFIQWSFTTLTLDEAYLVYETGVFNRSLTKVPLREIASIDLEQSLLQRFVDTGNLVVDMRGVTLLRMNGMDSPEEIQNAVLELRQQRR